jgi:DNA polymerase-3 subunit beta
VKLNISKSELSKAIGLVVRATASRPSVPFLSGILITVEDGAIQFFASDLETSIQTTVSGIIEEPGKVAVAGKILSNIVRSLPDVSVRLETEGETLHLSAGQSDFYIRTINTDDFIDFPEVKESETIELPASQLVPMILKVSKAASRKETRVILNGIYLNIEQSKIEMVGTDSYRLAYVEQSLDKTSDNAFAALVPAKALDEIARMLTADDKVKISVSKNQVLFTFGETKFVTRKIEGKYPNYRQYIPTEWNTKIVVTREEILDSARRVSLLALNDATVTLEFSVENQSLKLSAHSQDLGNAEETILVKMEGEDNKIAAQYSYLVDGLAVTNSDFITIELQSSTKPGVIRSPEENFIYLIMPIRVN